MNILFTCAGRRNYLINYFKEALKGRGKVIAADMQLSAPALVDADYAVEVPAIDDPDYIPHLENIIDKYKVDALFSLNDLELPLLSREKEKLESHGCRVIVSDDRVIDICFDKWKTYNFLKDHGLGTPATFLEYEKAALALREKEISFPVVVKPRWGSASLNIEYVESFEELGFVYQLQLLRIKSNKILIKKDHISEHAVIIQEKLTGKEYGMDILNDLSGSFAGSFSREKLAMRAGETDKAISIIREDFDLLGKAIGEHLGHIGSLDADLFEQDGELYVLELNPRFGGGYPFSHEAGMNSVGLILDWLEGKGDIDAFNQYTAGMMYSKCDRLLKVN